MDKSEVEPFVKDIIYHEVWDMGGDGGFWAHIQKVSVLLERQGNMLGQLTEKLQKIYIFLGVTLKYVKWRTHSDAVQRNPSRALNIWDFFSKWKA